MRQHTTAGYDFLAGADPYSDGVVAQPGHEIIHVTLRDPLPWLSGFAAIRAFLETRSRPMAALCGIEYRSPAAFSFSGFAEFNARYQTVLEDHDLLVDGRNPVARTNVVPIADPPSEVVLHAFSYTVEAPGAHPTFVTAGAGELEGDTLDAHAVIAAGDLSPEGMRRKAAHVMATMRSRVERLGMRFDDVTTIDVYTAADPSAVIRSVIVPGSGAAARRGVHWYPSTPPIEDLDFEMDVRGVGRESTVSLGRA